MAQSTEADKSEKRQKARKAGCVKMIVLSKAETIDPNSAKEHRSRSCERRDEVARAFPGHVYGSICRTIDFENIGKVLPWIGVVISNANI